MRRWPIFLCASFALAGCAGVSLQSPFVVDSQAEQSEQAEQNEQIVPAPVETAAPAAPQQPRYAHPATKKLLIEYRASRANAPPQVGASLRKLLEWRLYSSGAFERGDDLILEISFPEFKYEEPIGFQALFGKEAGGFMRMRARVTDNRGRALYTISGNSALAPGGINDAIESTADAIVRRVVAQFYDGPQAAEQPTN